MPKANFFQDPTKSVPTGNDPRIVRVPFDESEMGARKSNMPKSIKNDMNIRHVKEG